MSTIRTYSGGGGDNRPALCPFWESDYAAEEPWPFETMVFHEGSCKGLYHEAYASESEALAGHARIVANLSNGREFPGETVSGPSGNPTLTAERWRSMLAH